MRVVLSSRGLTFLFIIVAILCCGCDQESAPHFYTLSAMQDQVISRKYLINKYLFEKIHSFFTNFRKFSKNHN